MIFILGFQTLENDKERVTKRHDVSVETDKAIKEMLAALRCSSLGGGGARHRVNAVAGRVLVKRVYCSAPPPSGAPAAPLKKKHGEVSLAMGLAAGTYLSYLMAYRAVLVRHSN